VKPEHRFEGLEPATNNPPAPTNRLRRLVRSLRNLTALGLLTLSLGVLALWVRSYSWHDCFFWVGRERQVEIISLAGGVQAIMEADVLSDLPLGFKLRTTSTAESLELLWRLHLKVSPANKIEWPGAFGFLSPALTSDSSVYLPHWFVALVFALLAFALKPKPRLKFSLADLLVLMTFSAALIAGVARLSRLAS
jgi:hypothetical protein